jgi:hypothetical protein
MTVEQRLARLEAEVQIVKEVLTKRPQDEQPWWRTIIGTHENDPVFAEIVRLGREIREKDLVPVWKPRNRSAVKKKAGRKE